MPVVSDSSVLTSTSHPDLTRPFEGIARRWRSSERANGGPPGRTAPPSGPRPPGRGGGGGGGGVAELWAELREWLALELRGREVVEAAERLEWLACLRAGKAKPPGGPFRRHCSHSRCAESITFVKHCTKMFKQRLHCCGTLSKSWVGESYFPAGYLEWVREHWLPSKSDWYSNVCGFQYPAQGYFLHPPVHAVNITHPKNHPHHCTPPSLLLYHVSWQCIFIPI